MFENLKKRWKVKNNRQFAVIFLVFAITGSTAAKITGPILKSFSAISELNTLWFNVVYVIGTLIIYQFLLVFFGWLFGERDFFWNFVKRILMRIGFKRLFSES